MPGPRPRLWLFTLPAAVLAAAVLLPPLLGFIIRISQGLLADGTTNLNLLPPTRLALLTLAFALGIGALSTLLSIPGAFLIRARGWHFAPFLLVPLTLPPSLIFSALGLARAPGTLLGNHLQRLVEAGFEDAPWLVSRAIAILGLALWSWPIPALILAGGMSRLTPDLFDALRLDGARPVRRLLLLTHLCAGALLSAWILSSLLMLGSAVPLHLAEAPTLTIKTWMDLTLQPGAWQVWARAWPTLLIALLAAALITRLTLGRASASLRLSPPTLSLPAKLPLALALLVLALASLLPLLLMASSVREPSSYRLFWTLSGTALTQSTLTALAVALGTTLLTLGTWAAASGANLTLARLLVFGFCAAALAPGILLGSAWNWSLQNLPLLDLLADHPVVLVLAHLSRLGFLGVLAGCLFAALEPPSQRDARALDGATGPWGFLAGAAWPWLPAIFAVALLAALLSLHEIEASIMVQPPGSPSFAQQVLGYLHFNRLEELSALGVYLLGGSLSLATFAAFILRRPLARAATRL